MGIFFSGHKKRTIRYLLGQVFLFDSIPLKSKPAKKLFFSFLSSMIFFYSQYFDLIFLDFGDFVISRI